MMVGILRQASLNRIFLSHKQEFASQAQALACALSRAVPNAAFFRSEEIQKG
jgi:hypothetical protein